jgi:hypothetical protein
VAGTSSTGSSSSTTTVGSALQTQTAIVVPSLPAQLAGPLSFSDSVADLVLAAYLPAEAIDYGWDRAMVQSRWAGSISATVRLYWLMRVNDTASYIDISEPGGSFQLTQQWQQAKAMLQYWDGVILLEKQHQKTFASTSFGAIRARRRGGSSDGCCC